MLPVALLEMDPTSFKGNSRLFRFLFEVATNNGKLGIKFVSGSKHTKVLTLLPSSNDQRGVGCTAFVKSRESLSGGNNFARPPFLADGNLYRMSSLTFAFAFVSPRDNGSLLERSPPVGPLQQRLCSEDQGSRWH